MSIRKTLVPYVLASGLTAFFPNAHADLIGSQYSTKVVLNGLVTSNVVTGTVGSGVELPTGSLYTVGGNGSYFVIPVSIDLSANQITFAYSGYVTSAPGPFNGYVFDFAGLTTPILNAYLDPSSSFTSAQAVVVFSGDQVTVNVPSQNFTPSTTNVVDLSFTSAVATTPEPSTLVLLSTGLAGLGTVIRRRRMS